MRRVYIQAKELYGVLFAKYATHINSTVDLGLNREKRRGRFANCRAISPPGPAGGHRPRLARWPAAWAGLMQPGWAAAGAWPACCRALGRRTVGHLAGLLPRCWPGCAAGPCPSSRPCDCLRAEPAAWALTLFVLVFVKSVLFQI